jgi:hypothetical protein
VLGTPSQIDRTHYRANARSVGVGGCYLLFIDDASGGAFNPAQIARAGRYGVAIEGGARTDNVPVDALQNFSEALDDLRDELTSDPIDLDGVRQAFDRIYEMAQDAGARIGQARVVRVKGEIDPLLAVSYRNVGLLVYGGLGVDVGVRIGEGTGPNADKRTWSLGGGALDLRVIQVPYAFRLKAGHLGVGLKSIRGSYAGYFMQADASNNSITGVHLEKQDDRQFDLDVGFYSDPIPIKGGPTLRAAGVVRNLLSPKFSVPVEARTIVGPDPGLPSSLDFRLNPQLDLGVMAPYKRLTGVLELHNVTGTNAGELTVHLGAEYRILKFMALRGGFDADRAVVGLGFFTRTLRLDIGAATEPIRRVYAGLSWRVP